MITSVSNELVKEIKKLQTKKSFRSEMQRFIIEGIKQVRDAFEHVDFIVAAESFDISQIPSGKKIITVSDSVFERISETKTPQGVMAAAKPAEASVDDITAEKNEFTVIFCENIADPGNLGTIIRTADAAGVDGVILSQGCADLYNPKTVRSTMTSLFNVKIHICENTEQTLKYLQSIGAVVIGSSLKAEKSLYETDFPPRCVAVMGNESCGISEETLTICDKYVKIPMLGKVESLNVSVAAALIMYEAVRRRKFA